MKYNVPCNYRYGFSIILQQKAITQDFLFSYAQPEAQRSVAPSQDSNAFLVVNHWINNIFSQESTFPPLIIWGVWIFLLYEIEAWRELGETADIKKSSCDGNRSAKHIVNPFLFGTLAERWTSARFRCYSPSALMYLTSYRECLMCVFCLKVRLLFWNMINRSFFFWLTYHVPFLLFSHLVILRVIHAFTAPFLDYCIYLSYYGISHAFLLQSRSSGALQPGIKLDPINGPYYTGTTGTDSATVTV